VAIDLGFWFAKGALWASRQAAELLGVERPSADGVRVSWDCLVIARMSERFRVGLSVGDVRRARRNLERLSSLGMPRVSSVRSFDCAPSHRYETPCFAARVYLPHRTQAAGAVFLYFHGGGFALGSVRSHDRCVRLLVTETGVPAVSVDYRLAPEHPFPAAVEDALAAFDWLVDEQWRLGIEAERIVVAGDSAGGTLAAVVANRRRSHPALAGQALLYPALDATFSRPSHRELGEGYFLTSEEMRWFRGMYLPDEEMYTHPDASPIMEPDLSGVPPALVVTAGFDPLRDEGIEYVARLRKAGGYVRHLHFPDLIHGFFGMGVIEGGMAIARMLAREMACLLEVPRGR
jgi:acetyl esterase